MYTYILCRWRTRAALTQSRLPGNSALRARACSVYRWLTGTDLPEGRLPHFPGSQPVSLDRQNLSLLHSSRCVATPAPPRGKLPPAGAAPPPPLVDALCGVPVLAPAPPPAADLLVRSRASAPKLQE